MKIFYFSLLFFLGGCSLFPLPETHEIVMAPAESHRGLKQLQAAARKNFLEIQAVDSLQQLAGEHVDNQLLLRLPEAVAGVRAGKTAASPEQDLSLTILESAIAYNHLLTQGRNSELLEARLPRSAELLECGVAQLWCKLAAVSEEIELLGLTPERRQRSEEYKLELRVYTGLRDEELAAFRMDSLPEPEPERRELSDLQKRAVRQRSESRGAAYFPELSRKCKLFFEYDRATPLLIAEGLLRLPRRLEERRIAQPGFDALPVARLASALGVAAELELDLDHLKRAYEFWRLAKLKQELAPDDKETQSSEIVARLNWQLAYYRFLADMGTDDLKPAPETESEPDTAQEELLFSLLASD